MQKKVTVPYCKLIVLTTEVKEGYKTHIELNGDDNVLAHALYLAAKKSKRFRDIMLSTFSHMIVVPKELSKKKVSKKKVTKKRLNNPKKSKK